MSALDTLDKPPAGQPAELLTWPDANVDPQSALGEPDRSTRTGGPLAGMAGPTVSTDRRGKRTAQTIEALAERDRLVRAMAARFFGGMSALAAATAIHCELIRYQSSAWTIERVLDACPQRHVGRLREFTWRILKARDYIPSVRALRRTLANKHF